MINEENFMQRTLFSHDYFSLLVKHLSDSNIRHLHITCTDGKTAGDKYLALMVHNPELLIDYLSRMNREKLQRFIQHRFEPRSALYAALAAKYQADPTNLYTAACYALIGPANQVDYRTLYNAHAQLSANGIHEDCCLMQSLLFQAELAAYPLNAKRIQQLIQSAPNALHNLRDID